MVPRTAALASATPFVCGWTRACSPCLATTGFNPAGLMINLTIRYQSPAEVTVALWTQPLGFELLPYLLHRILGEVCLLSVVSGMRALVLKFVPCALGVGVPASWCICSFAMPALVSGVAGVCCVCSGCVPAPAAAVFLARAAPHRPMLTTSAVLNRNACIIIKCPLSVATRCRRDCSPGSRNASSL
jgi:hypothetical protein